MAETNIYMIDVTISVPIIGDRSIALLKPPDGFGFKEEEFQKYAYNKNMCNNNGDILLDYAFARYGNPEKILVLEHCSNYVLEFEEPICVGVFGLTSKSENAIKQKLSPIKSALVGKLRDFFALLHIYMEGDLAYRGIFVQYTYGKHKICPHINHFDAITLNRKPMKVDATDIIAINEFINGHTIAFNMLKNVVVGDLICSYHCFYDSTNYKNMFTIFEVLLSNGEFDGDVLAKRISVMIKSTDADIDATYKRFKQLYLIRNNAVHQGEITQITRDLLDELRNMVRDVIKAYFLHIEQYIKFNKTATFLQAKKNCIKHLNKKINTKKKWPNIKSWRTS